MHSAARRWGVLFLFSNCSGRKIGDVWFGPLGRARPPLELGGIHVIANRVDPLHPHQLLHALEVFAFNASELDRIRRCDALKD